MNLNPKTGEIELHKKQQDTLREASQIVIWLSKVDPKVLGIADAIAKYCAEPEADQRGPEGKGAKS